MDALELAKHMTEDHPSDDEQRASQMVSPLSPLDDRPRIKVLFVCLGNICRSPMAHGVLGHLARPSSLPLTAPVVKIDSAGTAAYHALAPPDPRTLELLKMHNVKGFVHSARKVRAADFYDFDYILAMDSDNMAELKRRRRDILAKIAKDREANPGTRRASRSDPKARLQLFGEYGGWGSEEVEDPYYGSNEGFDVAFEQCIRMSKGWMKEVLGVEVKTDDMNL